jgi:hypothetical protein
MAALASLAAAPEGPLRARAASMLEPLASNGLLADAGERSRWTDLLLTWLVAEADSGGMGHGCASFWGCAGARHRDGGGEAGLASERGARADAMHEAAAVLLPGGTQLQCHEGAHATDTCGGAVPLRTACIMALSALAAQEGMPGLRVVHHWLARMLTHLALGTSPFAAA